MTIDVSKTCPQSPQDVISTYFMEHRAKLIDIAAYLDRIDRGNGPAVIDVRDIAFREAVRILGSKEPHRAKRILELFSDMSLDIPQSAHGTKGAVGAVSLGASDGQGDES